jgi:hypothetical protein
MPDLKSGHFNFAGNRTSELWFDIAYAQLIVLSCFVAVLLIGFFLYLSLHGPA